MATKKNTIDQIAALELKLNKLHERTASEAVKAEENSKKALVIRKRENFAEVQSEPWANENKWNFEVPTEADRFSIVVKKSDPAKGIRAEVVINGVEHAPAVIPATSKSWVNQRIKDQLNLVWNAEKKGYVKRA